MQHYTEVSDCSPLKTENMIFRPVEMKLEKCEHSIIELMEKTRADTTRELEFADMLVNKEMKSKVLMSQWTNHFLAISNETNLDPITFAFSRYCLNITLCYADVNVQYFLDSNVHQQLIALGGFTSELVSGPAIMALAHLSLHHIDMRPAIVAAGVLPLLLRLMNQSLSIAILVQVCKLCASLTIYFPNKPSFVNSGCLHGILDLILCSNKPFSDENIQYAALCTVVNVVNGNDASRLLVVELNGVKPILTSIQTSTRNDIILEGLKALNNIAFNNAYVAGVILSHGGDTAIIELLSAGDIIRQPLLAQAGLSALANICNCESTQSHVGSGKGMIEVAVRVCEHARCFPRSVFLVLYHHC